MGMSKLVAAVFCLAGTAPELAATVLVATGFGAITAKRDVAKAHVVKHQIADRRWQQNLRQYNNLAGNRWDLAVAQMTNAEATSTTLGYCPEESQLASRNAIQLEGSL